MTEYKCGSAKQCQFGDMCKPEYDVGGCSHYKEKRPQTNEEWIHQCNTEQLAEWLQEHMDCASCGCNKDLCYKGYDCCKLAFLEWLKQPHTKE